MGNLETQKGADGFRDWGEKGRAVGVTDDKTLGLLGEAG